MDDIAGIRLQGYRLGNPSHFCLDCWEDRPEDFADAPGEGLSRMQAQGHVRDVCERALVSGEEGSDAEAVGMPGGVGL